MEKTANTHKNKPPYLLGLLCLIPLIGAFIGLGLFLYGIFRYKDKWLALIGVFGILFTVIIYSSLFYYMKNGDLSKKGFENISQLQLNSLIKNVEFYKLKHGQYPDSLRQLLNDDKLAPINDAIQSVQMRRNNLYIYQNLGNKYLLFSSGQDGIPNTKDDLFPQILIDDSSKIGWTKSR